MSIISMEYLWFCVAIFILYYTVFHKKQWILLLLASFAFYLISSQQYIVFIISSIVVTYFCTKKMGQVYEETKDAKEAKNKNKKILIIDLVVNITILAVIKYYNFVGHNINGVLSFLGIDFELPGATWILPLGISFYTFALLGYTLDVYWKRAKAVQNIAHLALFAMYFPHILQGPIARYDKLAPQFYTEKKFNYERTRDGLLLILYGLLKKVALANRISAIVSPYFDNYENYNGLVFVPVVLLYSMEIYADFSGCMDIVGGVSQLFGITLEKNFERPNFARTIPEFWQRWHISLGNWFKDYVFFPVSISKKAKKFNKWTKQKFGIEASRTLSNILPVCSVWLLTGIWHGAAWNFVIWGMFHCCLILGGTLFGKQIQWFVQKTGVRTECFSFRLFQIVRTYILCTIGRVFFRASSAAVAIKIFRKICSFEMDGLFTFFEKDVTIVLMLIAVVCVVSLIQEITGQSVRKILSEQNLVFRWIVYYSLIFAIIVFGLYGIGQDNSGFLYQQF